MVAAERARARPDWLSLREPADNAARARDLVLVLRPLLRLHDTLVVHDLGAGTGSMGRWLAPQLQCPQHWVQHDRDADLLSIAATMPAPVAGDGSSVTRAVRPSDVTRLTAADLEDADLVTCSALLDVLTAPELARIVDAVTAAGSPALFALTVTGRVTLDPADPLDLRVAAGFNAHQRRSTGRVRLLGPDAAVAAANAFRVRGFRVVTCRSPWEMGPACPELLQAWLHGWLDAAFEADAELGAAATAYAGRRTWQAAAGQLAVTVEHQDLLALPAKGPAAGTSSRPPELDRTEAPRLRQSPIF